MKTPKTFGLFSVVLLSSLTLVGCGQANNSASNTNTTGSSAQNSQAKTVNIGYDGYFEDVDATEVWKQILVQHGWNVKTTELNVGALFLSMSKGGSGDINTFLDVWMPHTHKTYMDKYGANLENLGVWHTGTRIGLVVPKYVYDQGIHSITQLNAHASMFKNQIIGITPGSGEMMTMSKKVMPGYGLKLNLEQSSGPAMLSDLEKSEKNHQPIVVTLWSPHWIFGKYQLKYLSDPKQEFGAPGVEQVEANKAWANQHSLYKQYMSNFKMSKAQIDSLGLLCQKDGKVKGAQEWIAKNPTVISSWLKTS